MLSSLFYSLPHRSPRHAWHNGFTIKVRQHRPVGRRGTPKASWPKILSSFPRQTRLPIDLPTYLRFHLVLPVDVGLLRKSECPRLVCPYKAHESVSDQPSRRRPSSISFYLFLCPLSFPLCHPFLTLHIGPLPADTTFPVGIAQQCSTHSSGLRLYGSPVLSLCIALVA